ncbi:MAG: DNRLRE domain-containing protein [Actinomycetota bacterium]
MATLCALVAAGLCVQVLLGAGLARGPRIRAVKPKADAFVSAVNRTENFGHWRALKVDSAPIVRSYVTFDVDLRFVDVKQVSLLLYSRTRLRPGYQVRLITDRWRESTITYANAPGLPPDDFVASGPLQAKSWKAVNVTSFVTGGERRMSFVLTTVSRKGAAFSSRETGNHGPRLIVESQDVTTSGTTSTESKVIPPS